MKLKMVTAYLTAAATIPSAATAFAFTRSALLSTARRRSGAAIAREAPVACQMLVAPPAPSLLSNNSNNNSNNNVVRLFSTKEATSSPAGGTTDEEVSGYWDEQPTKSSSSSTDDDDDDNTAEEAALSSIKSPFLRTMRDRGFLFQCTNIIELDALLCDATSKGEAVSAYLGFDATADSLHVGSLLQIDITTFTTERTPAYCISRRGDE